MAIFVTIYSPRTLNKTTTADFFLVFAFFLSGYNFKKGEKTVVKGDLAFELVSYTDFYGASDSLHQVLTEQIDRALRPFA